MDLFLFAIGMIGFPICLIWLVVNMIRRKPKKHALIGMAIFFVLWTVGLFMDGSDTETPVVDVEPTPEATPEITPEPTPKPEETPEPTEEPSFKEECEENARIHPARTGAILYTKGDNNFTGMKYHFLGEVVGMDTIDNDVGDPSVWLVKNQHGYVMPIQHEEFVAEIGDTVEVWGTLSGNGYANAEGIDNVVGQTGSMHAMLVEVNGEAQY